MYLDVVPVLFLYLIGHCEGIILEHLLLRYENIISVIFYRIRRFRLMPLLKLSLVQSQSGLEMFYGGVWYSLRLLNQRLPEKAITLCGGFSSPLQIAEGKPTERWGRPANCSKQEAGPRRTQVMRGKTTDPHLQVFSCRYGMAGLPNGVIRIHWRPGEKS